MQGTLWFNCKLHSLFLSLAEFDGMKSSRNDRYQDVKVYFQGSNDENVGWTDEHIAPVVANSVYSVAQFLCKIKQMVAYF